MTNGGLNYAGVAVMLAFVCKTWLVSIVGRGGGEVHSAKDVSLTVTPAYPVRHMRSAI